MMALLIYLAFVFCFHFSEFIWNYRVHQKADIAALLISKPYLLAQLICLTEFFLGYIFSPDWKSGWSSINMMGLTGLIVGQSMRWYALIHAKKSFTHKLRLEKDSEHQLVTNGPYSWVRHPGYLGWYIWTISSQILLLNPISILLFAFWGWRFLKNRVQVEEQLLVRFFGDAYVKYRSNVPSGIPFVK